MKKTLSFLLISLLMLGAYSCEKPQLEEDDKENTENTETPGEEETPGDEEKPGDETPETPETPENPENPGQDEPLQQFEFPFNAQFPIECGNLLAEGSDVGVTIEVKKLEDKNFVFELRPGAMVQSFIIDVYPVSQLYNNLLNDYNAGLLSASESWAINERIREYLFTAGSGGYSFSNKDVIFAEPEDFLQVEFDWMNTAYAANSAIAIPDCGYIIAVVGSAETEINSGTQEDLTLCYVHTTSQPLIGDPQCEINVITSYRAFGVEHILNADAAGVYYFGWLQNEIDNYIDTFGKTLFRDFVRTRVSAPSVANDPNNPNSLFYSVSYGDAADASIMSTTVAVAVDANLTPQNEYSRADFHLEEMPAEEDQPVADIQVEIVESRLAAAYMEFDAKLSKECKTMYYRVYSAEEAASIQAMTDKEKRNVARDLKNAAFGYNNPYFVWDKTAKEATGAGVEARLEYYAALMPGTDYVMAYVGLNGFGSLMELQFTDVFTTDERNLTAPANFDEDDFRLTLDTPTRTSFRHVFSYDPSKVSLFHFQYMTVDGNPGLWVDSSWKEWVDWVFTIGLYGSDGTDGSEMLGPQVNTWAAEPSGIDYLTLPGMMPDTEYYVFACAEDFDGNVSPMYFAHINTSEVQVGPDPTINMALHEATRQPYDWTVTYEIDHDVEYYLYCMTKDASDLAPFMPGINTSHLNNIAGSFDYETWYNGIYEWVAAGFENNGGGMMTQSDTSQDWQGSDVVIAACIAVGHDGNNPVYKMYHLICQDGKAQTLEEIFGIEQ